MRLLFDENLSRRLVDLLGKEFPGSSHPDLLDLRGSSDTAVWQHAREHNFTIVSKDNDFRQRAFLIGPPPKVVWVSVGNAGTEAVAELLRSQVARLEAFGASAEAGLLVLELPSGPPSTGV